MTKEEIIKQQFEEEYSDSTYETSLFSVYKELVEKCMNIYASHKVEQVITEVKQCECKSKPEEDGTKEETYG